MVPLMIDSSSVVDSDYSKSFLQEAKEKFQQLQKVISILGDEEKRAVYDQTGCVDDAVSDYPI